MPFRDAIHPRSPFYTPLPPTTKRFPKVLFGQVVGQRLAITDISSMTSVGIQPTSVPGQTTLDQGSKGIRAKGAPFPQPPKTNVRAPRRGQNVLHQKVTEWEAWEAAAP